ncbi:hypothetical protein RFI_09296 [Reticulomyxa filosa]|uniref:FYR C-terminal domain-containing protein n=1 Tax=Reticulomyxa filosa TaxID=46433 RepID=X6NNH2_RETFI|nr:hypothetical protein RFI_09296 [Reticulomyxa filosa]|eukprot:ETO27835.1 hypothetical protein RFI_09296 [Reticulomyxa filosa]
MPNTFREQSLEDIVRPFQFEPLMDANEYEEFETAKSNSASMSSSSILANENVDADLVKSKKSSKSRKKPKGPDAESSPFKDPFVDSLHEFGGEPDTLDASMSKSDLQSCRGDDKDVEMTPSQFHGDGEDGDESVPNKKQASNKKSKFDQTATKYMKLPRNEDGTIKVPFQIKGGCTVACLGRIDPDKGGFHTSKYIWPIGFQSVRMHSSYLNPSVRVTFTSTIEEGPNGAQFKIVAEDDPENPLIGDSASSVWTTVIKRVAAVRTDPKKRKTCTVSGPEMFGFSDSVVQALIEELPNAKSCTNYWKNRQPFKDKLQDFGFI